MRRVVTTADDFGLSLGVNEAVERAARDGILTSASLMVGAPAFQDAVERAKRTPQLAVGLHLVVIEGPAVLPHADIPDLVDENGWFPSDQLALGINYFFRPRIRRQLAREILAQFERFAATGLTLDHANAHKHMHLHPTVGRMMLQIGKRFGLRAVRLPAEPPFPGQPFGNRMIRHGSRLLRAQIRRNGLRHNDHCLGLTQTGHMDAATTERLLRQTPPGLTEIYFHPATSRDPLLERLMPGYAHEAEFHALLTARPPEDLRLTSFLQECAPNAS